MITQSCFVDVVNGLNFKGKLWPVGPVSMSWHRGKMFPSAINPGENAMDLTLSWTGE